MREKKKIFLSLVLFLGATCVQNVSAVEVIRPEDEELLLDDVMTVEAKPSSTLKGNLNSVTIEQSIPVIIQQKTVTSNARHVKAFDPRTVKELREIEEERQQKFTPETSPTYLRKKETNEQKDPVFMEFREAINHCLDSRAERLAQEKESFMQTKNRKAATDLFTLMAEINTCYEGVGEDIIEYYYQNDITMTDKFAEKAKTFWVAGNNVNFKAKNCDGFCTLNDVIEAQMEKFAEYRTYLAELLNNHSEVR